MPSLGCRARPDIFLEILLLSNSQDGGLPHGMPLATSIPEANNGRPQRDRRRFVMLGWAIVFLVLALIAAAFGFGGIAGTAAGIAQILFVVFLVLFVVSLFFGGRPAPMP